MMADDPMDSLSSSMALGYQRAVLPGVSRTFALTIPELPESLRDTVTNAYLLCRVTDTLEDHAGGSAPEKRRLFQELTRVVRGEAGAESLADDLEAAVKGHAPIAEQDLVGALDRLMEVNRSLPEAHREAVTRCVTIMAEGMARFQSLKSPAGLENRNAFDDYCYRVAGVVGEMLTDLFCQELPDLAERRDELMELGRDFGLGLQATNILKDVWDDRARGVCWLPRDIFLEEGMELDPEADWPADPSFRRGMRRMVGFAAMRLDAARPYIVALPPSEPGIRRFCTWAATMAHATLRRVHRRPGFRDARQVKIRRGQVGRLAALSRHTAQRERRLRLLLWWSSRGLPSRPSSASADPQ